MPRSLEWRSDLIFPRFDGEIATPGDQPVVRTPHKPNVCLHGASTWHFEKAPSCDGPSSRS